MKINREAQKAILLTLAETYPKANPNAFEIEVRDNSIFGVSAKFVFSHCTREECIANLFYLQEHELVTDFFNNTNCYCEYNKGRLTHKGIDFLLDDGGLSAILSTVTVKFHEETIKNLLTAKIEQSNLPNEQKSKLLNSVKNLSNAALEQIVTNLVDLGFEQSGKAIPLLQKWFASLL